jgi:hypothetical protein
LKGGRKKKVVDVKRFKVPLLFRPVGCDMNTVLLLLLLLSRKGVVQNSYRFYSFRCVTCLTVCVASQPLSPGINEFGFLWCGWKSDGIMGGTYVGEEDAASVLLLAHIRG